VWQADNDSAFFFNIEIFIQFKKVILKMSIYSQTTDSASQVYALEITCLSWIENVLEKELMMEGLNTNPFWRRAVK